ncbi:phosphatidylinositol-3-phosphatase SAC1 [Nilaparvata lugens]|uniref:phosphatidylinositol-3-phosphatase SAC1 n=1 Tax=Nilaparvata lugens TaxID=108931 RepID=UPI00193D135E|nr:phosphatidylinositol-3-phosphatase SAC1 [Nilaparvata lugens]
MWFFIDLNESTACIRHRTTSISSNTTLFVSCRSVYVVCDQPCLVQSIIRHITPENFYVVPADDATLNTTVADKRALVINRLSGAVTCDYGGDWTPCGEQMTIYGILGTIRLISGLVLVVVTERTVVGQLNKQLIFSLDNAATIQYSRSLTHLTEAQIRMHKEYLEMVMQVLTTPGLYFSYTYDITHTLQRLQDFSPDFLVKPMYLRAESRFVWNGHLLHELSRQLVSGAEAAGAKFLLPLMHGFVSIRGLELGGDQRRVTVAVVSRRSTERAGTRLYARGVDSDGRVANFVETEQILESVWGITSFVQIRGSIPLFWTQLPNLRYKPPPTLLAHEDHKAAFLRHLDLEVIDYGQLVCVSLIDQHGAEGQLAQAFKQNMDAINRPVRYEAFDFHAECRKLRWDRLNILIDRLQPDIEEFSLKRDGTLVSQQYTVIRTNCIDCLDRTNVVQYMLANTCLLAALKKHTMLRPGEEAPYFFEDALKNMWADNADMLSTQYSGTGALKTDFTRTGKRTRQGMIKDGINSITLMWLVDAIDLFLGQYKVSSDEGVLTKSPLEVNRGWKYITFPLILCVAIAMFCANVITPSEYTSGSMMWLLFWGSMCGVTFSMIMYYGHEFVDAPRLSAIYKSYRSRSSLDGVAR